MRTNEDCPFVIVNKPEHIFFWPNLLQNKFIVSTEVRVAFDKHSGLFNFRKIDLNELNNSLNHFRNNFLRPCYTLSEDCFYKTKDTLITGHIGLSEFAAKEFVLKLYNEYIEKKIQSYREQLTREGVEKDIESRVYELACELNNNLISLQKSNKKKFFRMVWIYFFPNYSSALGPKYFLSRNWLEKGKVDPELSANFFGTYIIPIIKKLFSRKVILTERQLEYRNLYCARLLLAQKLGWNLVYTQDKFKELFKHTGSVELEKMTKDAIDNNKITTLSNDDLIEIYKQYVSEDVARQLFEKNFI